MSATSDPITDPTGNRETYIRPSAMSAIALCAGRPSMEAAFEFIYGRAPDSQQASMGNNAHGWSAKGINYLIAALICEPADAVLQTALARLRVEHADATAALHLDKWTWWGVEYVVSKIHELVVLHSVEPDNIMVEYHLTLDGLGIRRGGTSDVILVVPGKLCIVVDHKFGFLEQEDAAEHDQIMVYALGAAREFSVPVVHVAILAPRADRDKRTTMAKFDAETMRQATIWVDAILRRARAPDPELSPNYTSCLYCKAITRCKPSRSWAMNVLEALKTIGDPADPDGWAEIAGAQAIAARFAEDAKEQCKSRLQKGGAITGWKLGSGRAIWSVKQVGLALELLEQKGLGEMGSAALSIKIGELSEEARKMLCDAGYAEEKPSAPSLKAVKGEKASVP